MDYKYINQLLERYWRCETSLEEEQILRSFFSQTDVPEDLRKYRSLFLYEQVQPKTCHLGEDFDQRMMSLIAEPTKVKGRRVSLRERLAPLYKAAAAVAIVLTLSNAAQFSFRNDNYTNVQSPAHASRGASVAINDSARIDTLKQSNLNAQQPAMMPIIK
jgi:hypothetical protein